MFKKSLLLFLWVSVLHIGVNAQGRIIKPTLWWEAQSSTSGVSSLIEKEEIISEWSNGFHATLNFHRIPVLDNQAIDFSARPLITKGGITVFSVYQDAVPEREQTLWSLNNESILMATASNSRFSNNIDSVEYAFAGITNQWLRLSTHFLNHQSLSNTNCRYHFGQHPHKQEAHFTGVLLEEVVFDRILSKKQRKQVESYLSVKYGVPLLSNGKLEYINSAGYAYWSSSKNNAFRHRPTALGRDDFWQLYQRQSTNAYEPGLITIGLGSIAQLNNENTGQLEDQSFLIWSDNNADLDIKRTSSLLDRVWEIQKTNHVQPNTSLRLGVRQLKTELEADEKFWLAIDRSGENTFSVQTTDYYPPSHSDDHEYLHYEGIEWDSDQSGKDHFTFLKGGELIVVYDKELPSCDQGQPGRFTFKVQGGTAPYNYQIQSLAINESAWPGELKTIDNISSGRYVLRITDSNGLQVEQEVEMYNAELYAITGLDKEYRIHQGEILELTLPGSCNDCSFEWQFPDGEIKSGHQISIAQPGNYQLEVKKGDCQDSFDFSVKKHQSPFQSVELWGNPSQDGSFVLEIRLWEVQPTTISILNQQGQLVQQITLPLNHYHKYEGQGLTTGAAYHIQVHSNGEFITKTLITL